MRKQIIIISALAISLVLSTAAYAQEGKMGFVDMRKLFFDYNKTKAFNKALEKEDEEAKGELEKRSGEIRKLRDEIDLLSDEAREKRGPELQKALEGFDNYRKQKAESFVRQKEEMFQEIREDIADAASKYAKKNDYNMILDGSVFVYSSQNYDITDDILKELNK